MKKARIFLTAAAVAAALAVLPSRAAAHCDSMDGPVVSAARRALASGNAAPVLVWVQPEDEAEIRAAFTRTLAVRRLGAEAESLADRWFFETLVRVHRAGEGEPYTGLTPAGTGHSPGIVAADRAVDQRHADPLVRDLAEQVATTVGARFEEVLRLADFDPADVEAGRQYVRAYVGLLHLVEQLHALAGAESGVH